MLKIENETYSLDFDPRDLTREDILEARPRLTYETLLPSNLLAPYGKVALLPRNRLIALLHACRGEDPNKYYGDIDGAITSYFIQALFKLNPNGHEFEHSYRNEQAARRAVFRNRRKPLEMGFFATQRDGHDTRSFIIGLQGFGDQQRAASKLTDTSFFIVTESAAAALNAITAAIDGPAGYMPGKDGMQVPYYTSEVAEPGTVRYGKGHRSTLRGPERLDELVFNDLKKIWDGDEMQGKPESGFAFYSIHPDGELAVVHDSSRAF